MDDTVYDVTVPSSPTTTTTSLPVVEVRDADRRHLADLLAGALAPVVHGVLTEYLNRGRSFLMAVVTTDFVDQALRSILLGTIRTMSQADIAELVRRALERARAERMGAYSCAAGARFLITAIRALPGAPDFEEAQWATWEREITETCDQRARSNLRRLPGAVQAAVAAIGRTAGRLVRSRPSPLEEQLRGLAPPPVRRRRLDDATL